MTFFLPFNSTVGGGNEPDENIWTSGSEPIGLNPSMGCTSDICIKVYNNSKITGMKSMK